MKHKTISSESLKLLHATGTWTKYRLRHKTDTRRKRLKHGNIKVFYLTFAIHCRSLVGPILCPNADAPYIPQEIFYYDLLHFLILKNIIKNIFAERLIRSIYSSDINGNFRFFEIFINFFKLCIYFLNSKKKIPLAALNLYV